MAGVDIPNYDVDDSSGNLIDSRSYVAPYVWQGRPIVFFLQMSLKQSTYDNSNALSSRWDQDGKAQNQTIPLWQINLGVSRFDNGKWTPKEISQTSLRHFAGEMDIKDNSKTRLGNG
jgi:Neuraminidase-like domain